MLGLSKPDRLKLRDVGQGEFYAFGPALGQPGVVHFRSEQVRTTHPRPGERHLLTAPAPSRAIRGVLDKFADLPQEAEDEILGIDEGRRRIAELERQIKNLRSAGEAQQIDQLAVDRAVRSAVERERVTWRRKLGQGRARFRQMITALASTGQSLGKVKELLEEAEREWLTQHAADTAPHFSVNHRPARTAKPANNRVPSAQVSDGAPKLASGERRSLRRKFTQRMSF